MVRLAVGRREESILEDVLLYRGQWEEISDEEGMWRCMMEVNEGKS